MVGAVAVFEADKSVGEVGAESEQEADLDHEEPRDGEETQTDFNPLFSKELRCMMYAFGDDNNAFVETVDILEDLVVKYITDVTMTALSLRNTEKAHLKDIMHVIRRDEKKATRVRQLLKMNKELKTVRKSFLFVEPMSNVVCTAFSPGSATV